MKRLYLFFWGILFIACSAETEEESFTYLTADSVAFIQNLEDEEKLITYKILDENEKYELWQIRKTSILQSKVFSAFNEAQREFIITMYESLKPEYFAENANQSSYYKEFLPKMRVRALELFDQEQISRLFSNFDDKTTFPKVYTTRNIEAVGSIGLGGGSGIHCGCNTGDDWCIGEAMCFFWSCDSADIGCGWWLQEDCNGFCATPPDN